LVNMDFAARIQGVPEPSMFAFFALGGLGLLARLRRRS
jgi:MYXO-CTERM domain-containing protein